jgi:hypothetical protein
VKRVVVLMLLTIPGHGQQGNAVPSELAQMVGKEVVVQRMPFCQPGTYVPILTYAGKHAKVVAAKPFNFPHLSQSTLNRMSPEARANIEDMEKSATVAVQFDDGTKLVTCRRVNITSAAYI